MGEVAQIGLWQRERVLRRDRQAGGRQLRCGSCEGFLLVGLDAVRVESAGLELEIHAANLEVAADISLERVGACVCTAGTTRDAGQR